MRSAPRVLAWKGSFRKPWTASVWKMALGARRWVSFAMAPMGITAPDSLFTIITETSTVSGRMASRSASRHTRPRASGFR